MREPTIFELSSPGPHRCNFPGTKCSQNRDPPRIRPAEFPFPEISELGVVRHFTKLSQKNYAIDLGFYPLGLLYDEVQPKNQ